MRNVYTVACHAIIYAVIYYTEMGLIVEQKVVMVLVSLGSCLLLVKLKVPVNISLFYLNEKAEYLPFSLIKSR